MVEARVDLQGVASEHRGSCGLVEAEPGHGPGEAPGCGAVGAAQAEADLPGGLVLGRVGQSVLTVDVADGGAGEVQTGESDAAGGALDQVGAARTSTSEAGVSPSVTH